MTIREVASLLDAEVYCGKAQLDSQVDSVFGSDLMSDVLAFVKHQQILLTGLVNPQVVRTADLMDMRCVILVRSKKPTEEMIRLAESKDIVLLGAAKTMYLSAGLLYAAGLKDGGIA